MDLYHLMSPIHFVTSEHFSILSFSLTTSFPKTNWTNWKHTYLDASHKSKEFHLFVSRISQIWHFAYTTVSKHEMTTIALSICTLATLALVFIYVVRQCTIVHRFQINQHQNRYITSSCLFFYRVYSYCIKHMNITFKSVEWISSSCPVRYKVHFSANLTFWSDHERKCHTIRTHSKIIQLDCVCWNEPKNKNIGI